MEESFLEDASGISRRIKGLQRELYRSRNLLKSIGELDESLNAVSSEFEEIEKMMDTEEARTVFREWLRQGDIVPTHNEIRNMVTRLKNVLERAENKSIRISLLLDSFTTARSFSLSSGKTALQFLEEAFLLYSATEVAVKPEFAGTIESGKIEKELNLNSNGKGALLMPVEKIAALLDYLAKSRVPRNLIIRKEGIKACFRYPATVIFEAENLKIKRIDRLYRESFSFGKC